MEILLVLGHGINGAKDRLMAELALDLDGTRFINIRRRIQMLWHSELQRAE